MRQKFVEFKQALASLLHHADVNPRKTTMRRWTPSPRGILKINSNAMVRSYGSFLSMVVRNNSGDLMESHFFKVTTQDYMIAELFKEIVCFCSSFDFISFS